MSELSPPPTHKKAFFQKGVEIPNIPRRGVLKKINAYLITIYLSQRFLY